MSKSKPRATIVITRADAYTIEGLGLGSTRPRWPDRNGNWWTRGQDSACTPPAGCPVLSPYPLWHLYPCLPQCPALPRMHCILMKIYGASCKLSWVELVVVCECQSLCSLWLSWKIYTPLFTRLVSASFSNLPPPSRPWFPVQRLFGCYSHWACQSDKLGDSCSFLYILYPK